MSAPSIPIIQPQTWASLSSITFYWAPPASVGGSAITSYTLLCSTIPYSTVIGPSTYNIQISSLTNNVDFVFQIAASNSNGTSPYAKFNLAQAGAPAAGASSVAVSTTDVSTVNVTWSYSTNVNESKAQFFGISILPSTGTTSTVIAVAYANERNKYITNLSTNNYTFLVQAITGAGWAFPHSYSFSPMTFVGNAIIPTTPFTPLAVPGAGLWLDGTSSSNFTFSSGSNIATWLDKSPSNISYSNYATAPTLTFDSTYGKSGVLFPGTNSGLFQTNLSLSPFAPTTFWTVITVSRGTNSANTVQEIWRMYNDTPNADWVRWYFGLNVNIGNTGPTYTSTYNQINGIICAVSQGSTFNIYLNGTSVLSGSRNATVQTSSANFTLGCTGSPGNISSPAENLTGYIYEVIVYKFALTNVQRQAVEGYLAWRYTLQTALPATHQYYTAAPTAPTAFTPTSIPGLQLWLDGADPLKTGTPPSNGSTLAIWYDKSGNAYNATGVSNPVFTSPTAGIALNGSSQYFSVNYAGAHTTETAFVVVKFTNTTGEQDIISGNTTLTRQFVVFQNLLNMYSYAGGGLVTSTTVPTAGTQVLLSYALNASTNLSIYNGGNLLKSATGFTPATETNIKIGVNGVADGGFLNGSISEVLIYNTVLSTTNRQIVEGYLAWKWGTQGSLPVAHPYYSAPITLIMPTPLVYLYATTYSGSGTWNDSSPNGKNATLLAGGTAAKNTAGNGIVLNGSTGWTFPNVALGNAFSFSIWYMNTGTPTGTYPLILSQKQTGPGGVFNMFFGFAGSNTTMRTGFFQGGNFYISTQVITPVNNVWTNYQVTWNGTTISFYIDGSLIVSNNPGGTATDSGLAYVIGTEWAATPTTYVNGVIGEVRMYNTPLTSAQVLNLYNTTFTTYMPSPLVYLYATTYSGSGTWNDSSPNGKNATLETGSITKNTAGNGLVLNGSTTWTFSNPALGNTWTVSAWYKNTAAPSSGNPTIVTQRFNSAPMNAILGYYSNSSFDNRFYTGGWFIGSTYTLTNGSWTNIQATWDGTNLSTYINGNLFGTVVTGGTATDSGQLYRIGGDIGNPGPGAFLRGEIGEVRIYKEPLNATQAKYLYTSTASSYAT
jgi:hypothetical protein